MTLIERFQNVLVAEDSDIAFARPGLSGIAAGSFATHLKWLPGIDSDESGHENPLFTRSCLSRPQPIQQRWTALEEPPARAIGAAAMTHFNLGISLDQL